MKYYTYYFRSEKFTNISSVVLHLWGYGGNATFTLLAIFQLYRGGQFYSWRKSECPKKIPDILQDINKTLITSFCVEYTSPWAIFYLTTFLIIGTDCTGSCKSNYHTIMTTMAPYNNYLPCICVYLTSICHLFHYKFIILIKNWSHFLFGSWRNNLNQVVHTV